MLPRSLQSSLSSPHIPNKLCLLGLEQCEHIFFFKLLVRFDDFNKWNPRCPQTLPCHMIRPDSNVYQIQFVIESSFGFENFQISQEPQKPHTFYPLHTIYVGLLWCFFTPSSLWVLSISNSKTAYSLRHESKYSCWFGFVFSKLVKLHQTSNLLFNFLYLSPFLKIGIVQLKRVKVTSDTYK